MVSKITLFEPRLEDVQIGPASMGGESTEGDVEAASSIPVATEERTGRRFPRVRRALLAGVAVAGIAGGVLAWRRFRGRGASDADEEPVIEERPLSSTAE
jgi:hypothetical protein